MMLRKTVCHGHYYDTKSDQNEPHSALYSCISMLKRTPRPHSHKQNKESRNEAENPYSEQPAVHAVIIPEL